MNPPPATLPGTEVHRLHAEAIGQEFEVRIAVPPAGRFHRKDEPCPVLYVTDGDLYFGTATEMTRLMHQLFGELPPLLVVAIGYGPVGLQAQGELRNRDFTPSADAAFEALGRRMMPDWKPLLPEGRRMGGAGAFLAFLEEQVCPFVASMHPVDPDGATLFGASLGGLFALYALLRRTRFFDRFVIASPAIWWDGEMLFDLEARTAGGRADPSARVFMGVGALEQSLGIPYVDAMKTVTNVGRMAERLRSRGYPGLSVDDHVFPDETHTSVVPAVLSRGLRAVLGALPNRQGARPKRPPA